MNNLAYPYLLWLMLLPIIVRALLPRLKGLHGDALKVPFIKDIKNVNIQSGNFWGVKTDLSAHPSLLFTLLYIIWGLLVFALARPQIIGEPIRVKNYSRDILMVMDISTSMLEQDFVIDNIPIDRLTAVKVVASKFIDKRVNDRVGIVLFGSRAYLQAPITYDKKSVKEILMAMDAGMAGNSTAIGDALGLALKSLKDSPDKDKKIIILLSDGENNDGALNVPQALALAKNENVKVYTIGVGGEGFFQSMFSRVGLASGLNETDLKQIAEETQGRYFRAKNTKSLEGIYSEIDKLEPTSNEDNFIRETKDLYHIPLAIAVIIATVVILWYRRRAK